MEERWLLLFTVYQSRAQAVFVFEAVEAMLPPAHRSALRGAAALARNSVGTDGRG